MLAFEYFEAEYQTSFGETDFFQFIDCVYLTCMRHFCSCSWIAPAVAGLRRLASQERNPAGWQPAFGCSDVHLSQSLAIRNA